MKSSLQILTVLTLAAGCATFETGVRDPERFGQIAERTMFQSSRSAAAVSSCFAETADLYPGSQLLETGDGGTAYVLRVAGFTFERITFSSVDRGSTVTIELAPGVDARWRRDMESGRLVPLRACLGS
ncbi:hypothetical protein [Aphanothece microscopica]|uniref:hypothetical protein n=1 Tax=Aphanothece microscopica TaxID=1049561 RepID=UPI003984BC92